MSQETSQELVQRGPEFDAEILRNLDSFDAAMALAQETLGTLAVADQEIGDGFAILDDKNLLVGIPCLFMSWSFHPGGYGDFVSAHVVARGPGGALYKVIVNDGGTGLYAQLNEYTERTGKQGGLVARHGLRASNYDYTDPQTGEIRPATTFYLDTSA